MAYLSQYLSTPRPSMRIGGAPSYYSRRSSPYNPLPRRSTRTVAPPQVSDVGAALLQSRQMNQAAMPTATFETQFDYDPIQQKIRALASQTVANAETEASQARKEAFIGAGDVELARTLGADENTVLATQQNPNSAYARFAAEYAAKQKQAEEARNMQGLFYSGTYADDLLELAKAYRASQEGVGRQLRDLLTGADQGVLSARENQRQQIEQAARDTAMSLALAGDFEGAGAVLSGAGMANPYTGMASTGHVNLSGTPSDPNWDESDWMYGATVPGYSGEELYNWALNFAPTYNGVKFVPQHVMNQGMIQNGMYSVKFADPTGKQQGDTVWIPLPPQAKPVTPPRNPFLVTQDPEHPITSQLTPEIQTQLGLGPAPTSPYLTSSLRDALGLSDPRKHLAV